MDRFPGSLDGSGAHPEANPAKRTNILASPAVMSMWGGVYVAGQPAAEFRIASEEVFMMQEFGAEYVEYMKTVKALIPFVW